MELKWKRIIWLLLTRKYFRYSLLSTIKYAINNYDKHRGDGASEVLTFDNFYFRDIVNFKK
jgi:hypothetical protein